MSLVWRLVERAPSYIPKENNTFRATSIIQVFPIQTPRVFITADSKGGSKIRLYTIYRVQMQTLNISHGEEASRVAQLELYTHQFRRATFDIHYFDAPDFRRMGPYTA